MMPQRTARKRKRVTFLNADHCYRGSVHLYQWLSVPSHA